MSIRNLVSIAGAAAVLLSVAASGGRSSQESGMKPMKVDQAMVDRIVSNWKPMPREVAGKMVDKYGMPTEASANRLIWIGNGPWKWTELVNEEIRHDFPMPHKDMLYQAIAWKVPVDKFDELAEYDGSVIVERTKGELGARCDKEEANFLAINLAHDIISGKRDAADARKMYTEAIGEMKHPEYMKGLRFTAPLSMQGDPDKATIDPAKMKTMPKYER